MGAATRDAFGDAILEIGADPRVVVLTGDLRDSTRTEEFAERYPDRFVECGIAENNMVGIAGGLAFAGKIPWACSFSTFVTGRFEVVRMSIAYPGANARIVGTHTGIGVGEDGYSQMAFEDVACMRTLPNMAIVQPADAAETHEAVRYLLEHEGPAFLRLTRQGVDDVPRNGARFEFGVAQVLRDGSDVALFGTGATVAEALKAADVLDREGISARVVNAHTIQPLDEDAVLAAASDCRGIVTVEDHSVVGGLGGAVAEVLAGRGAHAPLERVGLRTYGESGKPGELYEKYGLSADRVAETTRAFLSRIA
jgi:transketolase